jgi:hypothetical protein
MSQSLLTSAIGSSFLKSKNVDNLPSRHFTAPQTHELFGPRSVLIVYKQYVAIPSYEEKIMMHEKKKKLEYTVYKLLVLLFLSPVACLSIHHTSVIRVVTHQDNFTYMKHTP